MALTIWLRPLFIGLTCVGLLLAGCAPATVNGPASSSAPANPGAPKTIRIGIQAKGEPAAGTDGPASPAPYGGSGSGSSALEHFFLFHAALTTFNIESDVIPMLASKVPSIADGDWTLTPNGGMEVTWKLKPGLVWQDGRPLTSDDFVFGLQVIQDPELAHAPRGELASISEIRPLDSQTFVAVWKTQSVLGNSSGFDGIPAIPQHIFGDLYAAGDKTAFENSPLWSFQWTGLGPYRLTRWELGSFIEGTAFDQFVLGRAKIDRVIIKYFGNERALIPGILSNDIDVIPQGGQLHIENMLTVKNQWGPSGGIALPIAKGVRTVYLQLRDPVLPWQDLRVRQALLHAIDRDTLIEQLLFDLTSRADFFAPPDDQITHLAQQRRLPTYPFDLSRAERLLAEAGWTRGADRQFRDSSGRPLEISVTVSGDNEGEASAVAGQWAAAGFLSVATPYPVLAQNASEIRHTIPGALIWPYNFSQTAAQTFTAQQIGTEANRWRGGNYGGYTAPAFEDLYRKLVNTFDASQRVDVGFQLVQVLDEQLPALPLYFSTNGLLARAGVIGAGATSPMQAANTWNIASWDLAS